MGNLSKPVHSRPPRRTNHTKYLSSLQDLRLILKLSQQHLLLAPLKTLKAMKQIYRVHLRRLERGTISNAHIVLFCVQQRKRVDDDGGM